MSAGRTVFIKQNMFMFSWTHGSIQFPKYRYLDSVIVRISAASLTSHVFEDSVPVSFGIFKCLEEENDVMGIGASTELVGRAQ